MYLCGTDALLLQSLCDEHLDITLKSVCLRDDNPSLLPDLQDLIIEVHMGN